MADFLQKNSQNGLPPSVNLKDVKDARLRQKFKLMNKLEAEAARQAASASILLPDTDGILEAEGLEKTYKFTQEEILENSDVGTASKVFDMDLSFGPYKLDCSRNGKYLLVGGEKGSLSILDFHAVKLLCDFNVREKIRDVKFLQNQTLFAAAQKKFTYIYDHTGLEIHCLKDTMLSYRMEYLPYHFLLASIGEFGELCYTDVSTGRVPAKHKTTFGPCDCMCQNANNAIIHLGHTRGTVTLWTPSMPKPVVKMLCHKGAVKALDVHDNYMISAGVDGAWKVWDLRKYEVVNKYNYFGSPPSTLKFSQKGIAGVGFGPHIQLWKDVHLPDSETSRSPYLTKNYEGDMVEQLLFRPFEDILCVGRSKGISCLVAPGVSKSNYDSYESNPYESKKQRREREVHQLLEKLQPEMITLYKERVGNVDRAPNSVIAAEKKQENDEREAALRKNKKRKKKEVKPKMQRTGKALRNLKRANAGDDEKTRLSSLNKAPEAVKSYALERFKRSRKVFP